MTRIVITVLVALAGLLPVTPPEALEVVATIPTYGELARVIGGDLVDVVVICRPSQDLHAVTATPSFMARVRDGDLLLYTGLDAEPWLPSLLRGSGNISLLPGSERAVALSDGVALKEVPAIVSRAQGDIHAFGNVHVWTDPYVVRSMAARVRDALIAALPAHADEITRRHAEFHERLTRALIGWLQEYKDLQGRPVVAYHRSWTYLLERFGLETAGTIEPKPRVAPSASHLEQLIETMEAREVRVVIREPFQHPDATDFVSAATGARVLELSTHPGFPEGTTDIVDHFEHNLSALARALRADDA